MALGTQDRRVKQDDITATTVRRLVREGVKDRSIQRSNDGEPFTLLVNSELASTLDLLDVHIERLPQGVAGHGGPARRLVAAIAWEDCEGKGVRFKGHGLLSYFNNNMDAVMQALNGIMMAPVEPECSVRAGMHCGHVTHHARRVART